MVQTWDIYELNATAVADTFIMCGVLYGLKSATDRDTVINFAFDLFKWVDCLIGFFLGAHGRVEKFWVILVQIFAVIPTKIQTRRKKNLKLKWWFHNTKLRSAGPSASRWIRKVVVQGFVV